MNLRYPEPTVPMVPVSHHEATNPWKNMARGTEGWGVGRGEGELGREGNVVFWRLHNDKTITSRADSRVLVYASI